MAQRKSLKTYWSEEELEKIKILSDRISPNGKSKPLGQVIRKAALAVADNPDLDFIFNPGVCLNLPPSEIHLREELYKNLRSNIDVLKEHGINIDIEEEGEIDESKSETIEEDPS